MDQVSASGAPRRAAGTSDPGAMHGFAAKHPRSGTFRSGVSTESERCAPKALLVYFLPRKACRRSGALLQSRWGPQGQSSSAQPVTRGASPLIKMSRVTGRPAHAFRARVLNITAQDTGCKRRHNTMALWGGQDLGVPERAAVGTATKPRGCCQGSCRLIAAGLRGRRRVAPGRPRHLNNGGRRGRGIVKSPMVSSKVAHELYI